MKRPTVLIPALLVPTLLNRPELEARVDAWLKRAKLPRTACDKTVFTWNVFRIECDPQSVVQAIELIDITRDDLRDGALYRDPQAREPAALKRIAGPASQTFKADLPIDPEQVRQARAEADVTMGGISNAPVSLDAATRNHASEAISGTIAVTFDADLTGQVRRRTRLVTIKVTAPDGRSETGTTTETVTRKLLPASRSLRPGPAPPIIHH